MGIRNFFGKVKAKLITESPTVELDVAYHHKDRDPLDMIQYIIPRRIGEDGTVYYLKVYKRQYQHRTERDSCSAIEFAKFFRKGE